MADKTIDDSTKQPQSSTYGGSPVGQSPLDPTDNAQGMMNDTTGMTGVSKDTNNPNTPPDTTGPVSNTMSDYKSNISSNPLPEDENIPQKSAGDVSTVAPGSTPTGNETVTKIDQPHISGEQGVNATNPDPASDDDTLANAHNVGLRLDEDEEHPQELDIASDVDKAEEYHRTH